MTKMTVNGEAIRYRLDPATPLLWALRDASNLTGAKHGCDDGSCGACTVIADGRALPACSVSIAAMEGADITTIEGLSSGRAHPVQQAWLAESAGACGRCDPGFIMAAAALLQSSPSPTAAQIDALGVRCACGAQGRIRRAIERAGGAAGAAAPVGGSAASPSSPTPPEPSPAPVRTPDHG